MYHPKGIQLITPPQRHTSALLTVLVMLSISCAILSVSLCRACASCTWLSDSFRELSILFTVLRVLWDTLLQQGTRAFGLEQISQYTKQIISRAVTKLKKLWFFKENRGFSPEQSTYTKQSVKKHLIITKNKFNVLITWALLFEGGLALTQS